MEPNSAVRILPAVLAVAVCATRVCGASEPAPESGGGVAAAGPVACSIEGTDNCQAGYPSNDFWFAPSDRTLTDDSFGRTVVAADDFIPQADTLSALCVQGSFLNAGDQGSSPDCGPAVASNFRVRVYADDPVRHAPGTLLAHRWATVVGQALEGSHWAGLGMYRTQLSFEDIPLTPGVCHWLEVSDDPAYTGNDLRICDWYWSTRVNGGSTRNGNQHAATKPGGLEWQPMDVDLAFCLNVPFDEGGCGTVVGTCCSCIDGTCSVGTQSTCNATDPDAAWNVEVTDCSSVTCETGAPPGDTCQTVGDTCPTGGTCVRGPNPGAACTRGSDCLPYGGCNCAPNGPILLEPGFEPMAFEFTNNCAGTDGPNPTPFEYGSGDLADDVWFQYVVPGPSPMMVTFDTCGTVGYWAGGFDSWVAVYHDPANPTVCPACPPANTSLYRRSSDEGCAPPLAGGGGGIVRTDFVHRGYCFLVRVGGSTFFDDYRGTGVLSLTAVHVDLVPPAAPEAMMFDSNAGSGVTLVPLRMQRALGIRVPGSAGRSQAIRVHFKTLPPPWDVWNGTKMFLKGPVEVCEVTGLGPGAACSPNVAKFHLSHMTCDPYAAAYRDWTTVIDGTVFARHAGIVPSSPSVIAEYEVQTINEGYEPADESAYSPALRITQPRWGDIVGQFDSTGGYYVAPNGTVDVAVDVTAALNKFGNRPGAPRKYRAEVEPCVADFKINITDVTRIIDAFRNLSFPFSPTGGFGCSLADPCSYGP